MIGAIYLDQGIKVANNFIHKTLIDPIVKNDEYLKDENFKSQLLEYAQANKIDAPNYVVINEEGPQHDRTFTIKVTLGDAFEGIGLGKNKKTAEQNAAKSTLNQIFK